MPFQVLLGPKAERAFRKLSARDRGRIRSALLELEKDPLHARAGVDIKPLRGTNRLFRLRIGSWRAVYGIDGGDIVVTDLFPRSKGYDV